jgi:putative tryptophan/tyrosine transport system substrate-binding protein
MTSRFTPLVLSALLFALCFPADAQEAKKVYRIGYLSNALRIESQQEAFQERLHELGYVEGQNLVIEWRFSKGKLDLNSDLAADLVRLKVECIVTSGINPTRAAKQATDTIPIVMANSDDDPVRHGLVASLARPGGNVTGFTNIGADLAGKRLELLKEIVPKASRVAILWDPRGQGGAGNVKEAEIVAPALGLQLQSVAVRDPEILENSLQAAVKRRAEAVIVLGTGLMNSHRERIVNLAAKTRLPVLYTNKEFMRAGGLMSYAADTVELHRRAATYVNRILKGTKPADLPVEQPTKFELVINLKTAKQIGLTIPPSVLARADKVIK